MTLRSRRIALVAVLGGAGLLAAVLAARDDGAPEPRAGAATTRRGAGSEPSVSVDDLRLERLEQPRAGLDAPLRNPFRFEARPAAPRAERRPAPVDRAPAPPLAAAPPVAAGPPPIAMRYIGLVEAPAQAGRVAIVSDGRGNVFYGKEGDIIEGRYRVVRIGPDSLELSYLDGRGRQTIRLSGQ